MPYILRFRNSSDAHMFGFNLLIKLVKNNFITLLCIAASDFVYHVTQESV